MTHNPDMIVTAPMLQQLCGAVRQESDDYDSDWDYGNPDPRDDNASLLEKLSKASPPFPVDYLTHDEWRRVLHACEHVQELNSYAIQDLDKDWLDIIHNDEWISEDKDFAANKVEAQIRHLQEIDAAVAFCQSCVSVSSAM